MASPVRTVSTRPLDGVEVEAGTHEDYVEVARHYPGLDLHAPVPWAKSVRQVRVARLHGEVIGVHVATAPFPPPLDLVPLLGRLDEAVLISFRVLVHPCFRGLGVAALLDPLPTSRVVCVVRSVPRGARATEESCPGYLPIELPGNTRLDAQADLEKVLALHGVPDAGRLRDLEEGRRLVARLSGAKRRWVLGLVVSIHAQREVERVRFLTGLAGLARPAHLTDLAVVSLFEALLSRVPEAELPRLLAEAIHEPVQGYVKRLRPMSVSRR